MLNDEEQKHTTCTLLLELAFMGTYQWNVRKHGTQKYKLALETFVTTVLACFLLQHLTIILQDRNILLSLPLNVSNIKVEKINDAYCEKAVLSFR